MTTMFRYTLPVEQTEWKFEGNTEACFRWEYDDGRDGLLQLYEKGKRQQWNAAERIDWSQDLDPENPMLLDDRTIAIFGTDIWNRMTKKEQTEVRHHLQASQISQFMHGEQGALIATAKIVQSVPNIDAKFYAATQVMDEARHVEAYSRLLHEKFELCYPITHGLKSLLENGLSDSRWDMTYLTMQILIEGLALAAFQRIRDQSKNPLAAAVNAYVMQDEARHVAFGRLALLAHARPLQLARSLGAPRPPGRGLHQDGRRERADARLPQPHLQPDRADSQGYRPVGRARAGGLCGDGRDAVRRCRCGGAARKRRPGRRSVRRQGAAARRRREVGARTVGTAPVC
jgi:hypothetical protein